MTNKIKIDVEKMKKKLIERSIDPDTIPSIKIMEDLYKKIEDEDDPVQREEV